MTGWRDTQVSLTDVAEMFERLEPSERLEALVEFGRELPPLPDAMARLRDQGIGLILECESPVFVVAEVDGEVLRIRADAPREAPVARGFVGLLLVLFGNRSVSDLRSAPTRILDVLHLSPVLSLRRTKGLYGIYGRIRAAAMGEPGNGRIVG